MWMFQFNCVHIRQIVWQNKNWIFINFKNVLNVFYGCKKSIIQMIRKQFWTSNINQTSMIMCKCFSQKKLYVSNNKIYVLNYDYLTYKKYVKYNNYSYLKL